MKHSTETRLANGFIFTEIACVKTVTYPLRMSEAVLRKVKKEAGRRRKKVSELLREIIDYGLPSLPPLTNDNPETIADTWEKLGPAPEIDYGKL